MSASLQAAPIISTVGGSATYTMPTSTVYAAPTTTYTTAPAASYVVPAGSQIYAAPAVTTMAGGSTAIPAASSVVYGASSQVAPAQVSYPQVQVTQGPSTLTYMGAPLTGGSSLVMPSVQYGLANASGSVEVPVYGGSVDVQRMYQTYAAAAPAIQAPSPVQVSTLSGMTAEQLKFIFPHGAPVNYSPAAPAAEVVAASTVVDVPASASVVAETAVEAVSSKKEKKSSKKSSKKKVSSKKKSKGGCC